MAHLARAAGRSLPPLRLAQHNEIPVGSGLGSSAAAVVAGLLAADALLESRLPPARLLALATELEGHADNVAAALMGGLVLVAGDDVVPLPCAPLQAVVVLPAVTLSTRAARAALPASVPLADAIFNVGKMGLLLHALAQGNQAQLASAMADRLHQPYRTPLIPGLESALAAAHAEERRPAERRRSVGHCLYRTGPPATGRGNRRQLRRAGVASRHWLVSSNVAGAILQAITATRRASL